jgi:hypothetical protein
MIGVLMGDEEGVKVSQTQVDECQACTQLWHGQATIDQDLGGRVAALRLNQSGVASAATA